MKNVRFRALRRAIALLTMSAASATPVSAADLVNVYTYREPALIKPLFDAFTKSTGVAVNVLYASQGLEQRIAAEGANSPADVLITVDAARLARAQEAGVLQPTRSAMLEARVPASLRNPEGYWFGVSRRVRVLMYDKQKGAPAGLLRHEDLAKPEFREQILVRSSNWMRSSRTVTRPRPNRSSAMESSPVTARSTGGRYSSSVRTSRSSADPCPRHTPRRSAR